MLTRQREYVDRATSRAGGLGLIVSEAFVRGIRNIGYKSNIEALAELVDNSIQAYAERIDLVLGYADGGSLAKPERLAVIDDGHGMTPDMLRFAMMWGGTDRENDRGGLGRFGYGLPCATVSMGRRFTIYSKVKGGRVHAVSLDLDLLDSGAYRDGTSEITIPMAEAAGLPDFVAQAIEEDYRDGWMSGTVVVIDKLDRLDWSTATGLRRNLVRHFGVTYHKLLAATAIHVDGEQVHPIDPLFLDPRGEFHALDKDRAFALDPVTLTLDREDGVSGDITLRYSWLPPSFAAADKSRDAIGMNANARFPIIKAYHGLVFSRNGRVVDVQSRTPWTTFINNDRYIRVEVEFSAALDEAFGVTTSKQQVSLSPEMWDHLRVAGVPKAIEHLRSKVRMAKAERHSAAAEPIAGVGARGPTHRGTIAASAMAITADDAAGRASERAEIAMLVRDAVGATRPDALATLLRRIERRALEGDPRVATEYRRLLSGWTREMSRIPS
ncbi:MAG: ATP-binding protein [Proteobacteria bacterium ST_bin13]|nr:MAG: ATP-binding protein [Proteobacteria bacterium ST_bin13]